jgi:dihydropyrimidinase
LERGRALGRLALARKSASEIMQFDRVIANGTLVTATETTPNADLGIRGEKIVAIGQGLAEEAKKAGSEVLDASGRFVLPGALDVHVHLALPFCGTVSADDFTTGSRAGARGGVTTVIDFAIPSKTQTFDEAMDIWHKKSEGKSIIDYAWHMCVTDFEKQGADIKKMVEAGVPTFKEFMIYASQGWQSDDDTMFRTLEILKDAGGMLLTHAESSRVLDLLMARWNTPENRKKYGARLHTITRPHYIEWEAIQRACAWSEVTGGKLYVVHMSTGRGADIIRAAQERGVPVLAETCAQYLVLDDSVFERENGHLFACQPQLKRPEDSERLWKGLQDGEVSVISTDTCSFNTKQKAMWEGDFSKIPMGMPGLETLQPVVYTHGVQKGRLTLNQMVEKLSTNPARVMGLYPRKGTLAVGSDADFQIIESDKKFKITPAEMETNTDWSPFEGWDMAGFAQHTFCRGKQIVKDYKVVDGNEGHGKFLKRGNLMEPLR